jgi:hypothetical protein
MKGHWKRALLIFFFALAILGTTTLIIAGGRHSFQGALPPNSIAPNPTPSIQSASPVLVAAASSSQIVEIIGRGFLSSSSVTVNGVSHTATFINSGQLNVTLSASDVPAAGALQIAVVNPPPGGGTSANVALSIWNYETESDSGLHFSVPPLGGTGQLAVDTSTPGQLFIEYQRENGTSPPVIEFALTVYSNPLALPLSLWFENNVDVKDILEVAKVFQQQTLANGSEALVLVGPIPRAYFDAGGGPPIDYAYTELQSGQVVSIRQAPANDLADHRYSTSSSLLQLKLQILGTVNF